MKTLFTLLISTIFLLGSQDLNTSKENEILKKEDNSKTIEAIEDFMKKYSGVTKGC